MKRILIIPIFTVLIALTVAITPSLLFGPIHESSALTSTTTTLHSSPNPSVSGQKVTFAAVVMPSTATGTVTFSIDGVAQPAVTLTMGHATISTSTLSVGIHQILAKYSGDANFAASTSSILNQTVNKANTTTTLTSSANPSVSGQKVTFTAKIAAVLPGTGTPTGTVTFTIDGVARPAVTLSLGQAALSSSTLSVGTHQITAKYSGDTKFLTSTSSILNQTVNKASTTTTLTSSANPSVFGQTVTFIAKVAAVLPGTGTPTGNVKFVIDNVAQPLTKLVSGQANVSSSTLSVGTHHITAQYLGSTKFLTSTSSILTQTVNTVLINTKTTLTSSLNPSNSSQSVTFTATVAPISGTGTPTGTATFTVDGVSQPAVTLVGGQASMSTSTLSADTHQITAQYSGDTNFAASTSSILNQTVNFLVNIKLFPTATCIPDSPCQFNPEDVNIKAGSKVFWKNTDTTTSHTVTSDLNSTTAFASPILKGGDSFSFTFPNTGTFTYHCSIHPFMRGEVFVS